MRHQSKHVCDNTSLVDHVYGLFSGMSMTALVHAFRNMLRTSLT